MKETLNQLLNGIDLSFNQSQDVMDRMMQGEFTDPQIAGFLMALQAKGPVVSEIAGFAEAMRAQMVPVPITVEAIDMCGTEPQVG